MNGNELKSTETKQKQFSLTILFSCQCISCRAINGDMNLTI